MPLGKINLKNTRARKVTRLERGWGGHFICCHQCLFRRNTLLTCGRKKIVVSTVGAMRNREGKMDTIGHLRWYETMAFHAVQDGEYIEINVAKQIDFDSPWSINGDSWPDIPGGVDNKANDMHETVVAELTKKLTNGVKL